jgi:Recombination endonuclease VII
MHPCQLAISLRSRICAAGGCPGKRRIVRVRLGITEDRFNELLEAQGHACAMCREPFGDAFPQADHDHTCCEKQPKARAKTCGECIRGLLCFRCNTALGYIEKYGALAKAYLDNPPSNLPLGPARSLEVHLSWHGLARTSEPRTFLHTEEVTGSIPVSTTSRVTVFDDLRSSSGGQQCFPGGMPPDSRYKF